MKSNQYISLRDALQRMRKLSTEGIPFSFGFISCNATKEVSNGYKVVQKGMLRQGLTHNQSDKADDLIAYIDYDDSSTDKNRMFYYPLLMMFNGTAVKL